MWPCLIFINVLVNCLKNKIDCQCFIVCGKTFVSRNCFPSRITWVNPGFQWEFVLLNNCCLSFHLRLLNTPMVELNYSCRCDHAWYSSTYYCLKNKIDCQCFIVCGKTFVTHSHLVMLNSCGVGYPRFANVLPQTMKHWQSILFFKQ
jgi:hypothetical protein